MRRQLQLTRLWEGNVPKRADAMLVVHSPLALAPLFQYEEWVLLAAVREFLPNVSENLQLLPPYWILR